MWEQEKNSWILRLSCLWLYNNVALLSPPRQPSYATGFCHFTVNKWHSFWQSLKQPPLQFPSRVLHRERVLWVGVDLSSSQGSQSEYLKQRVIQLCVSNNLIIHQFIYSSIHYFEPIIVFPAFRTTNVRPWNKKPIVFVIEIKTRSSSFSEPSITVFQRHLDEFDRLKKIKAI